MNPFCMHRSSTRVLLSREFSSTFRIHFRFLPNSRENDPPSPFAPPSNYDLEFERNGKFVLLSFKFTLSNLFFLLLLLLNSSNNRITPSLTRPNGVNSTTNQTLTGRNHVVTRIILYPITNSWRNYPRTNESTIRTSSYLLNED